MLRADLRVLHVDTERGWRGGERQTLWLALELSCVAGRGAPGEPQRGESGLTSLIATRRLRLILSRVALRRAQNAQRYCARPYGARRRHGRAGDAGYSTYRWWLRDASTFAARQFWNTLKYGRAVIIAVSRAVAAVLERRNRAERIRVVPP